MRKLRDLIAELRPAALDDLGLGPAIGSLAKRQAAIGGFTADLKIELGTEHRLHRDTETAIYRIVQEALSNVVKHADAQGWCCESPSIPAVCRCRCRTTAEAL